MIEVSKSWKLISEMKSLSDRLSRGWHAVEERTRELEVKSVEITYTEPQEKKWTEKKNEQGHNVLWDNIMQSYMCVVAGTKGKGRKIEAENYGRDNNQKFLHLLKNINP